MRLKTKIKKQEKKVSRGITYCSKPSEIGKSRHQLSTVGDGQAIIREAMMGDRFEEEHELDVWLVAPEKLACFFAMNEGVAGNCPSFFACGEKND